MNSSEMIQLLGGVTGVARSLGIKPPSVHAWIEAGIPEGRLIELAARLEQQSGGRFSRKAHWPDRYATIWPELATREAQAGHVVGNESGALHVDA
jgi:DNA-binding transcriptional regulator YdaS (Cro superfamily)